MILIYEQDLTHYRASFYDFLSKRVGEGICVVHGKGEPGSFHVSVEQAENRAFEIEEIQRYWIGRTVYFHHPRHMKKFVSEALSCVIHRGAIRNIGILYEIQYYKKKGVPVVVRGQGYSRNRDFNPRSNLADRYHKSIVDSANAFLCYTKGDKDVLDQFSDPEKIVVGVNTLNTDVLESHYQRLVNQPIAEVRKSLGLRKERYLCYIGRLSKRKRLDIVIDTFKRLKQQSNIGLVIIGDGDYKAPLEERVKSEKISDVVFTGALSPDDYLTSRYIFASDIVFIPGWLGLAVNHAFILGKPIVGYIENNSLQNHGPESGYIIDGYNSVLAQEMTEQSFADAITLTFARLLPLSKGARAYALENLTVEKMAEGYVKAIQVAKRSLKRR